MEENIVAQMQSYLVWTGLLIGFLLGALVQRSNFCMANCFTSIRIYGSFLQFKSYMVALLVAMAGVQLLKDSGMLDPFQSMYLPTNFPVLGYITGGFIFGIGIVFAGGCASRILVRVGEGNLGALVSVFAVNLTAGSALAGHLAYTNEYFFRKFPIKLPSSYIPDLLHVNGWILIGAFAVFLAAWFYKTRNEDDFAGVKWPLIGVLVGLLVVAGWYVTAHAQAKVMADEFLAMDTSVTSKFRPASLTFAKTNADFFAYIATASGSTIDFGIATVIGVLLGSFAAAMATKSFHWVVPPHKRAFLGHFTGGLLMGYGAIIAMGCNIGQGLTGCSVMGLGGVITVTFIILGSWTALWIREKTG
ncbi:YeeE/YedE family protein [Candidatus Saganbacteria bacterium]|uniref:YeeE/YedE family protein n=1 Tax=Candidatus Saganbacteria bacterium TaxID=2575572 RepID=A0A9D6YXV0_UNCSA|nr:YeeE/YedE family protein [Candidatus Saganbacteria bacterium]